MNFRIEPLTVDYLDRCVEVFIAAFTKPGSYAWHPDDVRVRLEDLWAEPKRIGLMAIDGEGAAEQLSGFALGNIVQVADGPALRIGELCILPSRQGYGLGSRLLLGMEELAREVGAHSSYLTVQPDSIEFCQRLGYERQDEWVAMGRRLREPATVEETPSAPH